MAALRKHWRLAAINVLLVAGILGFGIYRLVSPQAKATDLAPSVAKTPPLDALAYTQVQALRQELCLQARDLAAMGCDQRAAQNILQSLLSWYRQNQANLEAADQAIGKARRELRETLRQINIGPRDELILARVPGLKQAVQLANAQRKQLLEAAAQSISPQLSGESTQIWNTARANATLPDAYRYVPNLTPMQGQAMATAVRKWGAGAQQTRQMEDRMVGFSNRRARATAEASIQSLMLQVANAEEAVLPMPEELKACLEAKPLANPQ